MPGCFAHLFVSPFAMDVLFRVGFLCTGENRAAAQKGSKYR